MWSAEPSVLEFLKRVKSEIFVEGHVVEIGSRYMHDHDPRPVFEEREYIGIDPTPGPGVDIVALGGDILRDEGLRQRLDGAALALSLSALEHDPHWRETIEAMCTITRPGGVIAISVPSDPWAPHEIDCSPGGGYYENRSAGDLLEVIDRCITSQAKSYVTKRHLAPHWPRTHLYAVKLSP